MFGMWEIIIILVCGVSLGALVCWKIMSEKQAKEDLDGAAALDEFSEILQAHKNIYVAFDILNKEETIRAYSIYVAAVAQMHFKSKVLMATESYTFFKNGKKICLTPTQNLKQNEGDLFLAFKGSAAFSRFATQINREGIEIWEFT